MRKSYRSNNAELIAVVGEILLAGVAVVCVMFLLFLVLGVFNGN